MSVNIATVAQNAAGNAIVDLIDIGTLNSFGYIEIRTGVKPASPQTTTVGTTLLVRLSFSNPAFADFVNGKSSANVITPDEDGILATGVASWFRIYDRNGAAIMDGDITPTGIGGDIEFDDINFVDGGTVSIDELLATMPQ